MQGPIGYPPPTLIRKRSGLVRLRTIILLVAIAVVLGTCTLSRLMMPETAPPASAPRHPPAEASAKASAAATPAPPVTIEAPGAVVSDEPPIDGRKPNRWYYVPRLGDGPAAIYSRTGGQWNYAFACTTETGIVEFIAVGTGSPGAFDRQAIEVGKVKLMMDATYSKLAGGTISTKLPARHPFFNALDGATPMEVQLLASRKVIVPVGPAVVRLIRECRRRG